MGCSILLTSCIGIPSKETVQKKTKKYLENKYGEEFVVKYSYTGGNFIPTYNLTAHSVSKPSLEFPVVYELSPPEIKDQYDTVFLTEESKTFYSSYFQDVYKGNYHFRSEVKRINDYGKKIRVKDYQNWSDFLKSSEKENYNVNFGIEEIKTLNSKTIKEISGNIYQKISKCKQDGILPDQLSYKFYHELFTDPESWHEGSSYDSTYYDLKFVFNKNYTFASPIDVERLMRDEYPYLMNWTADCKIKDMHFKHIYDCFDNNHLTSWVIPTSTIHPDGQQLILKNDETIEISGLIFSLGDSVFPKNKLKNVEIELSDGKVQQYNLQNNNIQVINFGKKYKTNLIKIRFKDYYQAEGNPPKDYVEIFEIKINK